MYARWDAHGVSVGRAAHGHTLHPRAFTRSPSGVAGQSSAPSRTPSPSESASVVVDVEEVVVVVARGGRVVLVAVEVVVRVDDVLVDVVTPQAGIGACEQTPATVHWSVVQMSPSSVQALPAASRWQRGEQQSPAAVLPSSHCSPAS